MNTTYGGKKKTEVTEMKWRYASLSDYPQTANVCLVETPDAYRIMWYSNMDKRWYSDTGDQYSDDDPYNCFKWVYIDEILEAMTWGVDEQ